MDDKTILFNMIDRSIDNFLCGYPVLSVFSGYIKRTIFNFLSPYVDMFTEGTKIDTDVAANFISNEMQEKIKSFKKNYEEAIQSERHTSV